MVNKLDLVCHLCGHPIDRDACDSGMRLSREHIPPKQFFPKALRTLLNPNLDCAPAHMKCNSSYQKDEAYFYHSLYPLVANSNPHMGNAMFDDFKRRCGKPQTPALLRKLLSNASAISEGGIVLPARKIEVRVDLARIQRVAGKIARGSLFLSTRRCCPESSIVDIKLCEEESGVPEMYRLSWQGSPIEGAYPKVYSWRCLPLERHYVLSLLFWEAFMFCVTIRSAQKYI